jgi:hypothetical protein
VEPQSFLLLVIVMVSLLLLSLAFGQVLIQHIVLGKKQQWFKIVCPTAFLNATKIHSHWTIIDTGIKDEDVTSETEGVKTQMKETRRSENQMTESLCVPIEEATTEVTVNRQRNVKNVAG